LKAACQGKFPHAILGMRAIGWPETRRNKLYSLMKKLAAHQKILYAVWTAHSLQERLHFFSKKSASWTHIRKLQV